MGCVTVGVRGGLRAPTVTGRAGRQPVGRRPRAGDEQGAVTAEAAMVLPVIVGLALALVWLVALAAAQVRVVDGARETARVAARGETDAAAVAAGRAVAPHGTRFALRRGAGQVTVTAVLAVEGPGGLLGFLPSVPVRSTAVAVEEPS